MPISMDALGRRLRALQGGPIRPLPQPGQPMPLAASAAASPVPSTTLMELVETPQASSQSNPGPSLSAHMAEAARQGIADLPDPNQLRARVETIFSPPPRPQEEQYGFLRRAIMRGRRGRIGGFGEEGV